MIIPLKPVIFSEWVLIKHECDSSKVSLHRCTSIDIPSGGGGAAE